MELKKFIKHWNKVEKGVHINAVEKGWWDEDRNDGEMLCLIHAEVSEALEALRNGNPPDDHISDYSGAEAELADVVIRIMDLAYARDWDVAGAIAAKTAYNKTREFKHGKKF